MFNDNLNKYRKQKGLSQEELAFRLGVSRQSVSKWESGQSTPELERIIEIADLFGISLDELIGHESNDYVTVDREELSSVVRHVFTYEYKSKFKIGNVPLIHINLGRGFRIAKGIIAIGNIAVGLFSFGALALGVFSLGGLAIGLLTLAGIALGGLSIGYFAVGGMAIGIYAIGGMAIATKLAIGGMAHGYVAIGSSANGAHTLVSTNCSLEMISNFILRQHNLNAKIVEFLLLFIY